MAITTDGRYYVMGEDGITTKATLEQGDRVLTNADLADLRANKLPYANNISTVIANGVSMDSINKTVWDLIGKIGKDSTSKEFFKTKKGKDIKEGIDELLAAGQDGVYKITESNTDQSKKARVALTYLLSTMPNNAKALLRGKAALSGLDPTKGAYELLAGMISSGIDSDYSIKVDYDKNATEEHLNLALNLIRLCRLNLLCLITWGRMEMLVNTYLIPDKVTKWKRMLYFMVHHKDKTVT